MLEDEPGIRDDDSGAWRSLILAFGGRRENAFIGLVSRVAAEELGGVLLAFDRPAFSRCVVPLVQRTTVRSVRGTASN